MDSCLVWMKLSLVVFALVFGLASIVFVDAELDSMSNVALHKSTFQSSQLDSSSSSDLAVDDNVTTCSMTDKQKGANWTIDLGDIYPISHMKINVGGMYFGSNFEVYVSTMAAMKGVLCSYGVDEYREEFNVSCFQGPVTARSITIINIYANGITLCEFQAFVCTTNWFGVGCTKQCRCKNGDDCNKASGHCSSGCASGWNGTDCQSECPDGTFGPSCVQRCHCQDGILCDKVTGKCPEDKCASLYVGPACQTEKPRLNTPPSMYRADVTQITIVFYSWIGFVDPSITLLYQVQYKFSSDFQGNLSWTQGPLVNDRVAYNEEVTVADLQRNSFYIFRVIPILNLSSAELVYGDASPESTPFRTKCSVPETPNITNLYSWIDTSRHTPVAVISVEWMPLTPKQSNCESILYYEILYQKHGTDWKNVGAKWTESSKNISSDLSFGTEYLIRIVAYNNHPYPSTSELKVIVTPAAPVLPVPKNSEQNVAIIASIVVLAGLLLALILAFIIYRQKMRSEYRKMKRPLGFDFENHDGRSRPSQVYDDLVYTRHTILPGEEIPKKKPRRIKKRPPIKVGELEDYISSRQENECDELRKEYRDIPEVNNEASTSIGERVDNQHKNRFINIIPYDHSRVVLTVKDGDSNSDYINASYIDGYKKPQGYIASQGCNKATTQDFWRMVWESGSHRIVMVTNLVEKGKIKCEQYWPDKRGIARQFHDISVFLIDEEKTADYVIRTMEVRFGGEARNVKQFHYTAWPDHGVPSRAGPIILFRQKVRLYDESHPGVVVVHCSAGVGRTGAFIALDCLLEQAKEEGQIDVFGLTCQMRRNRGNMIQTVEQYFFVYNALLEALKCGNTVMSCTDFRSEYNALNRVEPATGKSKLQEQFELLQSLTHKTEPNDCLLGQHLDNQDKNRFSTILPADRHRPYLMTKVHGTNDYINAVFLDGYRSRNAYIMTQMPLPHTVIDLWRMIYEHKCGTIVMLNQRDEQDETYGQYWPEENEECECGPFLIEIVSISNPAPDVVLRKLKLSFNFDNGSATRDSGPRIINHFQLKNWSSEDLVPPSPRSLVALIELCEQSQKKTGNSPIVIHCHDGVTQSGLYTAVSYMWERLRDEQEVDVFQTVKHLHFYRQQIIRDLIQYQFLYEMVLMYLADFSTYSNFK